MQIRPIDDSSSRGDSSERSRATDWGKPGQGIRLWRDLFRQLHRDERGGVSIETVLLLAAIAVPTLIFVIKFGWPRIKKFFNEGMTELEGGALDAADGETY